MTTVTSLLYRFNVMGLWPVVIATWRVRQPWLGIPRGSAMGHVRLGRLPKTRRWAEVIALLTDSSPEDVAAIASATVQAADRRLRELARDPSLTYCFWLL